MARIIEIVPYNSKWPQLFIDEAKLVQQALGDNCIGIHHVGSTSIVDLCSKPVIDMMPVVKKIVDVDNINDKMIHLGYESKMKFGTPFSRFFMKGGDSRTHNVHVYEENNAEINRHLKFRDWLREHDDDRKLYEDLKIGLAYKYSTDPIAYYLNKDLFLSSIDTKTCCDGLRIVKTFSMREWESARFLSNKFATPHSSSEFSPQDDSIHFTCYLGARIIGFAVIDSFCTEYSVLKKLVIDDNYRCNNVEIDLLNLCDRWVDFINLKTQNLL